MPDFWIKPALCQHYLLPKNYLKSLEEFHLDNGTQSLHQLLEYFECDNQSNNVLYFFGPQMS